MQLIKTLVVLIEGNTKTLLSDFPAIEPPTADREFLIAKPGCAEMTLYRVVFANWVLCHDQVPTWYAEVKKVRSHELPVSAMPAFEEEEPELPELVV